MFFFFVRYAEMEVSFSTADWVVSLGVGAEIPRMGEKLGRNLLVFPKIGVSPKWMVYNGKPY